MSKKLGMVKKFKIALILSGMTMGEFAKMNDVTQGAVSLTVNGKSTSGRLNRLIMKFVNRYVPRDLQDKLNRE